MKIRTKFLLLMIFIVCTGLFISGYMLSQRRGDNASQTLIDAQAKEIQRYQAEIDDKTVYISRIEQEVKTLRQAKQDGDVTNEELRKLNIRHLTELTRAKLRIDTLLTHISHNGGIVVIHDTIEVTKDQKAILLPFSFVKSDQWLNLNGTFNSEGVLDVSLKIDVPIDLYVGTDKSTKQPTAQLSTTNPYIQTLSLKSQKFDTVKPKKIGIGLFMGYGVNLSGTVKASPIMGVGVSYNFLRF